MRQIQAGKAQFEILSLKSSCLRDIDLDFSLSAACLTKYKPENARVD
jgi:hypothetical protein